MEKEDSFLDSEEVKKGKENVLKFSGKNSLIFLLILFLAVDIFFSALIFKNQQNLQNRQLGQKNFWQKDSSLKLGDSCCKLGKEFGKENLKGDFACCQNDKMVVRDSLKNFDKGNIPKISEIKGPRIDDEAAAVERVAVCNDGKETCSTLPTGIWLFLLVAYGALLIFNLAYNFKQAMKIQWFWELLYTLLALAAWYAWDSCGAANIWYPEFVLKTGIVIYGIYLYFFQKK